MERESEASLVRSNVHIELPKTIYTLPYCTARFHSTSKVGVTVNDALPSTSLPRALIAYERTTRRPSLGGAAARLKDCVCLAVCPCRKSELH
jgi:hypothetical protein